MNKIIICKDNYFIHLRKSFCKIIFLKIKSLHVPIHKREGKTADFRVRAKNEAKIKPKK